MRGFDAREGQDIDFSVGGVPINEVGNLHGNGYADTHFIIPELVETFRVLEGPFDPRQGNFAVAGSANYELGLADRGTTVKGTFNALPWRDCVKLDVNPPDNGTMHFADAAGATLHNYAEYMTYDQRTQGHLNSDGLCFVKSNN